MNFEYQSVFREVIDMGRMSCFLLTVCKGERCLVDAVPDQTLAVQKQGSIVLVSGHCWLQGQSSSTVDEGWPAVAAIRIAVNTSHCSGHGCPRQNQVSNLRDITADADPPVINSRPSCSLSAFTPVTIDEVMKLLSTAPNKHCKLDPCPPNC